MSLEDHIKHTGEHLLGSLEYDPARHERITERIAVRAKQRRQRAAAGLGAGVVVVIGGLIVLSIERAPAPGPVAATPEQPVVTLARMVSTTVAATIIAPTSAAALVEDSPATTSAPRTTTASTVVAPIADDAPMLFTALHDGRTQAIDLSDGTAHEVTDPGAGTAAETAPSRSTDTTDSFRYELGADPVDACGQRALSVIDAAGAPVTTGLPAAASEVLVSDDGGTGLLHVADCADPANVVWHVVQFAPIDPTTAATEVPYGDWPSELSTDGRFALVGDDDSVTILALPSGEVVWSTDPSCGDLRADASTGFLMGDAGFAALGNCAGQEMLLMADLPAAPVSVAIEGCAALAALDVLERSGSVAADGWMAVHDAEAGKAWVVSAHGVSAAFDVGDKVWWEQAEPAGT